MTPRISLLKQGGWDHIEARVASHYAMSSDVPLVSSPIEQIANFAAGLQDGQFLPVGSVRFVRAAMHLAGIAEPANLSYPAALRPFLRRGLHLRPAGCVLGEWFIKPTTTKTFTGFVFDARENPEQLSDHDRIQYQAFLSLEPQTPVWISEPVQWLSEYRYYVIGDEIRGMGRYDDGPDDWPSPDGSLAMEMARVLAAQPDAPRAFSLDVGVLANGETALVECNDAWALGYYKGSLSHRDYFAMLHARWQQLLRQRRPDGSQP